MFARVFIAKFPNENKKNIAATVIGSLGDRYKNDSKLLDLVVLDIGEGKILNIAKYPTKKDFEEANKWLQPEFSKMVKELDGLVESFPGEVIYNWNREDN